jgi:hypothetical protein
VVELTDVAAVRAAVQKKIGGEPDDRLWGYLVEKRYVARVIDGLSTVDNLVSEYLRLLASRRCG